MDRWTEMELFVQVAETGSLSRAADALHLSNAAVSRHMAAMEERLGARLVERNTRRLIGAPVPPWRYCAAQPRCGSAIRLAIAVSKALIASAPRQCAAASFRQNGQ